MDQNDKDREPAAIAITVECAADDVTLIRTDGEVDQLTAPELSDAIGRALGSADVLLLDLSGVSFLGSAGLAVLVEAAGRAEKGAQQLRLVADSAPVLRPLALTGLDMVLSVHPTKEAALKSLTNGPA